MLLSTVLACTSEVWFLVWCGLEFSVLSFLLYMSSWGMSSRIMLLYFVSQIFGSFLMVTASVITTYSMVGVLLVASIMYKMGFAPGNLWASSFVGGIGLGCALWFYVLLKVAPVTFVGGMIPLVLFSVLSFLVGIVSIGGSMLLTTFLYWSSLVGVVWLLLNDSVSMMWLYYIVYSVIMSAVLMYPLTADIGVFSFAGLPPFALFFAKVLVLGCAIIGLGVVLVASAASSIVYYSRWLLSARVDRTTINTQSTGYVWVLLSK